MNEARAYTPLRDGRIVVIVGSETTAEVAIKYPDKGTAAYAIFSAVTVDQLCMDWLKARGYKIEGVTVA